MCGIAGLVGFSEQAKYIPLLQEKLRHRGPDGHGAFVDEQVLLVHTRLSIIDTSEAGNQPLFNEEKDIALVCNGEIYNFQSLRARLEQQGHRFASHSDSEVIIHLYEELKGDVHQLLNSLRGMFAFALYDIKSSRLIIARDRFGIKPLYCCQLGNKFAFASEIQALVALPLVPDEIDVTSLYEYFQYLSIPEPNTIYRKVKAVEAGTYVEVSAGAVQYHTWYDTTDRLAAVPERSGNIQTALREKLEETIGLHMIADVPVGSFLSAGIDSTLVTQMAAQFTSIPFTTVSAAFAGTREDESVEAAESAASLGLSHHAIDLGANLLQDPAMVYRFFDQPFAVPSSYSLFHISAGAKQYMKVVLTGDGGDEVFAGYDHKHIPFYKPRLVKLLPKGIQQWLSPILKRFQIDAVRDLGAAFSLTDGDRFLNRTRVLSEQQALEMLKPDARMLVDKTRLKRQVDAVFAKTKHLHPVRQMLLADFATFLKSEMLYKVDRMTMANAIEARVPLLDHELVEIAFSIPVQVLRQGEKGKIPLRNLVSEALPKIAERKKTGFLTPFTVSKGGITIQVEHPQLRKFVNEAFSPAQTDEGLFFDRLLRLGMKSLDLSTSDN